MDYLALAIGLMLGGTAAFIIVRTISNSYKSKSGELNRQVLEKEESISQKQNEILSLTEKLATTETENKHLLEQLATNKEAQAHSQKEFREQFQNLAGDILHHTSKKFTEHNKVQIESVLSPLKESVQEFKKRIETTHTEQAQAKGELLNELKNLRQLNSQLSTDANNLITALKGGNKAQGAWGEMILDSILSKSGLTKGIEYQTEDSYTDLITGRRLRPDVVIRYPEDQGCLIIDSKMSLAAYERYCSEQEEQNRQQALKQHLDSIKLHIKELSNKNYQKIADIKTPDFVLMFIPIEPAFTLAIQSDPKLYEFAFDKNIILITPSTLLATLRLVKNIWNQDRQNRYALEIADRGGRLYDKFVDFYETIQDVGKHINRTQQAYSEATRKLHDGRGSLTTQVEKLKQLGIKASKALPDSSYSTNDEP
ncbi:MAG: DNA recombination protein RmuC [Verrucomicrobiota bacterium]